MKNMISKQAYLIGLSPVNRLTLCITVALGRRVPAIFEWAKNGVTNIDG